jgi:hypothetical protein
MATGGQRQILILFVWTRNSLQFEQYAWDRIEERVRIQEGDRQYCGRTAILPRGSFLPLQKSLNIPRE